MAGSDLHPVTENNHHPALLLDWLTPLYDLFARLFMPEMRFKRDLITLARIAPGQRVLDLGAGTGTLAIMVKQVQPKAQVTGLDSDTKILNNRAEALRHPLRHHFATLGSKTISSDPEPPKLGQLN